MGVRRRRLPAHDPELRNLRHPQEVINAAESYGIPTNPLDVLHLTRVLGVRVSMEEMEEGYAGKLIKEGGADWRIIVNRGDHPYRQRYTISHELAHYFLHRDQKDIFVDKQFFRNFQKSRMEREADAFAAELLMPTSYFEKAITEYAGNLRKVSNHFQVSRIAAKIRAKDLGFAVLLDEA